MFHFKWSQFVILIILSNFIIGSLTAIVGKTSPPQPYISPSKKLSAYSANVSGRSNINGNLQNAPNQPARLSGANLTNEAPINSPNDNTRLHEEITSSIEPASSNFTMEDAQITLANDKTIESNVSNSDAKPFEEDLNKTPVSNNPPNPSQYYNDLYNNMVSQINILNSDNLEYSNNEALKCAPCSLLTGVENVLSSPQLERCCTSGFKGCCSESFKNSNNNIRQNIPSTTINEQNNSQPLTNLSNNSPINPNAQIPTNKNTQPSSTPELYGTKTKSRSPAAKISNPVERPEEQIDVRQQFQKPAMNSNAPIPGYIPGLQNAYILSQKDNKIYYEPLDKNYNQMIANMQPYPYTNQYGNLNLFNNLYGHQFEHFGRKTSNPNRYGTKSGSSTQSISDSSINQAVAVEQQFQSKQQSNENIQPITNSVAMSQSIDNNLPISSNNNDQATNQINTAQQNANINTQRINTRNPTEITQQQQHPQQGGITNAFSSFVSHIPFIGFNPIPVVFGSTNQQQQQQQQISSPQMAQIVTTADNQANGQIIQSNYPTNYPYNTVIAIRPQTQNAQLINPSQLQTKVVAQASPQPTNNQAVQTVQNPGFVSTIFSRPYNLYQRIGGYFTRPNKPILHYANSQYIPIDYLTPELLNDPNVQNLFQQYSHPITTGSNQNAFDTVGQFNPNLYFQLLKEAAAAKSSKRS